MTIEKTLLRYALALSVLFQIILAAVQVYLGHSLGGLMYYVGERNVSVGSPGIAQSTFMDGVVLRAYGTFSHPNILAGWLVIVLIILLSFKPNSKLNVLYAGLTTIGVALTGSRAAAISLFGIIIPFYLIKKLKYRILYFIVAAILVFQFALLTPARSDLSLSERRSLQSVSLSVIRSFPIFGTGANASITSYPAVAPTFRLLQPDHNSFTLFLSWFGLFGILAILSILRPSIFYIRLFYVLPLLPLLLLDHYLFTSPQGLFIFILYLTLTFTPSRIR